MALIRNISSALVGMATVGLAFPQMSAVADTAPATQRVPTRMSATSSRDLHGSHHPALGKRPMATATDVRLDAHGRLNGRLRTPDEATAAERVTVQTVAGTPVASVQPHRDGSFVVDGLRPGVYRVVGGRSVVLCRVWDHASAPPAAQPSLELQPTVVRGQNAPPDVLFDENGNPYGRVRVSDAPAPPQPVPETGGVIYEPAPAAFAGPDIFTLATLGAAVTGAVLGGVALHEAQKGGPASP